MSLASTLIGVTKEATADMHGTGARDSPDMQGFHKCLIALRVWWRHGSGLREKFGHVTDPSSGFRPTHAGPSRAEMIVASFSKTSLQRLLHGLLMVVWSGIISYDNSGVTNNRAAASLVISLEPSVLTTAAKAEGSYPYQDQL